MAFVPGERGKKPNPKILSFNDYNEYAKNGKTIAWVSKLRNFHEAQCRQYITDTYPSLLEQYKANQTAKYKTTQAKLLKASKPVVIKEVKEPVHNGLKLALNYKNSIKLWRNCIICAECKHIIGHVPSKQIYDELYNLHTCSLCGITTTVVDVQMNPYRQLILLKKNHMSSEELREKEETC